MFTFSRYIFDPTTKALEETWGLVGDSMLAFNVASIWLSNRWLFTELQPALYITRLRMPVFDVHIAMEVAWYISLLPYTKDRMMFVHHLLSAFMGMFGFYYNVTYIGFLLISIMIWSNIPLSLSKILHEQRHKYTKPMFILFAFTFFITRIVIFPFVYIPIVLFDVREEWLNDGLVGLYYGLNMGLFVLAGMQFIWFVKIIRLVMKPYKENRII